MKPFIIASLLFLTSLCHANPPCASVTAYYVGPAGGSICCQGTNCSTGTSGISVNYGSSCADTNKPTDCQITVDLSGANNSCSWGGSAVVHLVITCTNGHINDHTIYMPNNACWSLYYIIGHCDTNNICDVSACDISGKHFCTCNFIVHKAADEKRSLNE